MNLVVLLVLTVFCSSFALAEDFVEAKKSTPAATASDHLFSTWKNNNRTNHELAYKAGKKFVAQYAKDPRAAIVKKWIAANEKGAALKEAQVTSSAPPMIAIPGKNYEIGKYAVTQAEWIALMKNNPSKFTGSGDNSPVEMVSWNDAQEFIKKLNAKTGRKYRLPTEAEWEYACYGGSQTEYCGGNNIDSVAWHKGNSNNTPHPVGQKQANSYGLYDMSGNVWEWMDDCWEGDCSSRVLRGGSWLNERRLVLAAFRYRNGGTGKDVNIGFRLARTLP